MEASVTNDTHPTSPALFKNAGSMFLRRQSDERLVALTRRGNETAFETLVEKYRPRLLAFCRHMVGSTEDAEDIMQESFVAAHRAMLADDRPINVRPWLYRIARNRSLNHLRKPKPSGVDSMDIYEAGAAASTADRVHDKLELDDLIGDVHSLPETQRTALMLREMGGLSYDQIALAMDTSIPSVKSLLVRARVSLAEASESRKLTCDEVRIELAAVAEGLKKISPPVRRHVSDCERCRAFKKELAVTNRKLAILAPIGPLLVLKHVFALKLLGVGGGGILGVIGIGGGGGSASAGAGAAAGASTGAGAAGSSVGVGAGIGAVAGPAAAGLATVAIAVGGIAQVTKNDTQRDRSPRRSAVTAPARPGVGLATGGTLARKSQTPKKKKKKVVVVVAPVVAPVAVPPATEPAPAPVEEAPPVTVDEETSAVVLDPAADAGPTEPVPPEVTPPVDPAPDSGATAPTGATAQISDSSDAGADSVGSSGSTE
ncbi:MAG: sigma-70 family RNA polymerase sigma factor [Thermoleophilaceae bacterium]|nr:sigma-70 family RNA polymerase sigma factor [Thermoleophilaceae bacterium]